MEREVKETVSRKQGSNAAAVSPCAACKLLRRRCAQDCIFAPHFPAEEPQKFATVHKVFGASNVSKLLQVSYSILFLGKNHGATPPENSTIIRKIAVTVPPSGIWF